MTQKTWWFWERFLSSAATWEAISPPTLASTSSNTRRGVRSDLAKMALRESITRAVSPDEAILLRGMSSWPALGAKRNSQEQLPCSLSPSSGRIAISSLAF